MLRRHSCLAFSVTRCFARRAWPRPLRISMIGWHPAICNQRARADNLEEKRPQHRGRTEAVIHRIPWGMASGRLSPSAPGDIGSNRVLQEQVTAVNVVAVQTFTRVIMRHLICLWRVPWRFVA